MACAYLCATKLVPYKIQIIFLKLNDFGMFMRAAKQISASNLQDLPTFFQNCSSVSVMTLEYLLFPVEKSSA